MGFNVVEMVIIFFSLGILRSVYRVWFDSCPSGYGSNKFELEYLDDSYVGFVEAASEFHSIGPYRSDCCFVQSAVYFV